MSKQKKTPKTDDEIISDALFDIRKGIMDGDIGVIVNAYNSLSGEDLTWPTTKVEPEPPSRLDSIRARIISKAESIVVDKPQPEQVVVTEEEEDEDSVLQVETNVGGIKIISSPINKEEMEHNKKRAPARSPIEPRKSVLDVTPLRENTSPESPGIRRDRSNIPPNRRKDAD